MKHNMIDQEVQYHLEVEKEQETKIKIKIKRLLIKKLRKNTKVNQK